MEALEEEGEITDKADIFAYGLTLWEMMTLEMPHLDMLGNDEGKDDGEDAIVSHPLHHVQTLLRLSFSLARMFTRSEFTPSFSDDSMDEEDFDEDAYYENLGTRPALDSAGLGGAYQGMVELFCLCTEVDAKKRPSAAQIVQALESNTSACNKNSEVIVID